MLRDANVRCCCVQLKPQGYHDLVQALHSSGMSRSIFMFVALAAATVAAASDLATGAEGAEDYWAGAVWQDLQLLFSFVLGILFVRSAETILDESGASGRNQGLTKLQLYSLLS